MKNNMTYTLGQALNIACGIPGFIIILSGTIWYGSFSALRLVLTNRVVIDDLDLSILDLGWLQGLYLYGKFYRILNFSGYPILAYVDGTKSPLQELD